MLNIRPFNLTQQKRNETKRKAVDRKYSLRNITKKEFFPFRGGKKL